MRFGWLVCILVLAAAVAEGAEEEFTVPPFVVEKSTTYFVGPLRKDGVIDYVAAINDKVSEGVTKENNAVVPLMEALTPEGATQVRHYAMVRERLGLPAVG